jgi:cytochrome c oxidase accessory protein FixG
MAEEISFRDRPSTVGEGGKRQWIYAKIPSGTLTNYRLVVAFVLLAFFFITPHIRVNGDQFLLLNIMQRKFILFGSIFWPQDTYLLGIAMATFVVFIVLFTVVYGRVWCGWACPQTVFMEIVFRRVETFIDGNPAKQKKLREQDITIEKIHKRITKFIVFLAIIFFSVNTFVSYFVGTDGLSLAYRNGFKDHTFMLGFILFFSFVGMFIYWWFREQACTVLCPYGRLQGALVDNDTMIVAYDYGRGEPRGTKKQEGQPNGDCIDCHNCIAVCPTGIDIRNGSQLECVSCLACIDACNAVMKKMKRPAGLIRVTSESSLKVSGKFRFTGRIIMYSMILSALLLFLGYLINLRTDIETTILRTPGMIYQVQDSGRISNLYNIRIVNKTRKDAEIHLKTENIKGTIRIPGNSIQLKAGSSTEMVFVLLLDSSQITTPKREIVFGIYKDGKRFETFSTTFVGPKAQ